MTTTAYDALRLERLHTAPTEAQDMPANERIGAAIREICRLLDEDTRNRAQARRHHDRTPKETQ
ncbi:hypothetical protein ACI3EY_16735 [Ornithinimicrobium sp. LYQ92]|uniref:hypothetical protein n=1 Tax=Serinicoccus sp. LYQ92 TaxID=3378798 RepID=UPI003853E918